MQYVAKHLNRSVVLPVSGEPVEPPEFSPSDLSGLYLWLDADDASTITESAGSVSQWDDKSGNGYHATQGAGSLQPITGTRTINGKNTLDFNGSHRMGISDNVIKSGARTIFTIGNLDALVGSYAYFIGSYYIPSRFYAMTDGVRFGDAAEIGNPTTPRVGTDIINVSTLSGKSATADLNLYLDNGNSYSTVTDLSDDAGQATIGAYSSGSSPFDGRIAEIIMYGRVLSASEINQVCAYASSKWGMSWTDL